MAGQKIPVAKQLQSNVNRCADFVVVGKQISCPGSYFTSNIVTDSAAPQGVFPCLRCGVKGGVAAGGHSASPMPQSECRRWHLMCGENAGNCNLSLERAECMSKNVGGDTSLVVFVAGSLSIDCVIFVD